MSFEGNFVGPTTSAQILTSAIGTWNDKVIAPIVTNSANLKLRNSSGHTFNLRFKPFKLLAHADFGLVTVEKNGRTVSASPYAFYAGNRDFNRSIVGLGHIVNFSRDLTSHVA